MNMHIGTWKYPDPIKQSVYFRGYVEWYDTNKRIRKACTKVHRIKSHALTDAKNLLKTVTLIKNI